jgi:hypothetical protein
MVISKSARSQTKEKWIAGVYIFSGRPDPIWSLNRETVEELEKVWESLENAETATSSPPGLGYRGCFVRDRSKNREWNTYRVDVSLRSNGNTELRIDNNCRFEALVLSSAPQGTLPESLLPR